MFANMAAMKAYTVFTFAVLFGAFQTASCLQTDKTEPRLYVPFQDVYVAVQEDLELNCSISNSSNLQSTQLRWKHNDTWISEFTHVINNNTLQLRRENVSFEDGGFYECAVFNSSQFMEVVPQNVTVLVGVKPTKPTASNMSIQVFGMPPQNITVFWIARQVNVTYELRIGHIPDVNNTFWCKYRFFICSQVPTYQDQVLSCTVERSVLGQLFRLVGPGYDFFHCKNARMNRCVFFCIMLRVSNAFGSSLSDETQYNLMSWTRCPSPRNLQVSVGEYSLTARWRRPLLVSNSTSPDYHFVYKVTPLLGGFSVEPQAVELSNSFYSGEEIVYWMNSTKQHYAKYEFGVSCYFYPGEFGPEVRTEVTTREAAPSEPPFIDSCEVKSQRGNTRDVRVVWKTPPNNTWNGLRRKFVAHYRERKIPTNVSTEEFLTEFNGSVSEGILKDLDRFKDFTVHLAMCTGGGCGDLSRPCSIAKAVNDTSKAAASTQSPGADDFVKEETTGNWIAIGFGVVSGVALVVFYVALKRRQKRLRRKKLKSLVERIGLLNDFPRYENEADDRPSLCEVNQDYDELSIEDSCPLLKDTYFY